LFQNLEDYLMTKGGWSGREGEGNTFGFCPKFSMELLGLHGFKNNKWTPNIEEYLVWSNFIAGEKKFGAFGIHTCWHHLGQENA
jgi:hypothetical protein